MVPTCWLGNDFPYRGFFGRADFRSEFDSKSRRERKAMVMESFARIDMYFTSNQRLVVEEVFKFPNLYVRGA